MKLALEMKEGDALHVGDALVRLERKSGRSARLVVDAPSSVTVRRIAANKGREQFVSKMMAKTIDGQVPAMP